jgi:hypothetical protein
MSRINGPHNVVRLEGIINGQKKILYLFFDIHYDIFQQTKCDDFDNIDIGPYFQKELSQIKSPIDFFMEISPEEFGFYNNVHQIDRYFYEMRKFFLQNFNKKINNVRFHYVDVRNYTYILKIAPELFDNILKLNEGILLNEENITNIKNIIEHLIIHYNKILDLNKQKSYSKNEKEQITKIIIKIHNVYNIEENRTILTKIYDFFINRVKKLLSMIHELQILFKSYIATYNLTITDSLNILYKLKLLNIEINKYCSNTFLLLMDIYMIRRFVDKSYILNGIIYAGGYHCLNYIYILVRYFNMQITHTVYSSLSIDKLNKKIASFDSTYNVDYCEELSQILFNPNISQCVDLKDFPKPLFESGS